MTKKQKEKLIKFFNEKNKTIIVVIGILAIIFIFLSNYFTNTNTPAQHENIIDKNTSLEYSRQLEKDLSGIISGIEGAGECKVMVTLENGIETKYATQGKTNSELVTQENGNSSTQTKQSGDTQTEYIIIKNSDGTQQALQITEIEPTVKGVVVVCSGGENPTVQQRIISAVTTALNISSKKVCVTKLSN